MKALKLIVYVLSGILCAGCFSIVGDNGDDSEPVVDPTQDGVDPSTLPAESWFTVNYQNRTDVQKAGFRGPVHTVKETVNYVNGGPRYNTYTEWEYDRDGNLVRVSYVDEDEPDNNMKLTMKYDSEGHRTEAKMFNGLSPAPFREYDFKYHNDTRLVAFSWYNWVGETFTDMHIDYSFDVLWRGLSESRMVLDMGDSHRVEERTYTFDSDGNLTIHTKTVNWNDWDPEGGMSMETKDYPVIYSNGFPYSSASWIVSCSWHLNGMPAKLQKQGGYVTTWYETYYWLCKKSYTGGPEGMLSPIWEDYSYDSNWDITSVEAAYASEDDVHHYSWNMYGYDRYGNWVKRNYTYEPILQPGEFSTDMLVREIKYWE